MPEQRKVASGDLEFPTTLKMKITRGNSGIYGKPGETEEVEVGPDQIDEMNPEKRAAMFEMPGFKDWYDKARATIDKQREEANGGS